MNPAEVAFRLIELALGLVGPALVRKKVDEWEAANAVSRADFIAKFGIDPDDVPSEPR